jgi:hypothetical protein
MWTGAMWIPSYPATHLKGTHKYSKNLCCTWDGEWSPEVHVLKCWCPGWWYWEMVELLRGGAFVGDPLVIGGMPLKKIVGPQFLPLSLLLTGSSWGEHFALLCILILQLPCHKPKAKGIIGSWNDFVYWKQ